MFPVIFPPVKLLAFVAEPADVALATVPVTFAPVRLVKFAPDTAPKDADQVPEVTVPVVVKLDDPARGEYEPAT